MGTQMYMAPVARVYEGRFASGLTIVEALTGWPVCSPAPDHRDLLSMFEKDLDNPTKLLAHLDKRACWDQDKQERIGRLHSIAEKCLERVARAAPSL